MCGNFLNISGVFYMYKVVRLNKYSLDILRKLNSNRELFNISNENFFSIYEKSNFPSQIFIRRRVRLLFEDDVAIGYVWIEPYEKDVNKIKSLYVQGDYNEASTRDAFEFLLHSLPKKKNYIYSCLQNDFNDKLLKDLYFSIKGDTITLRKDIEKYNDENKDKFEPIEKEFLSHRTFVKDKDEELRCQIQNDIFKNKKRIPLSVDDIYFDEAQEYYMEEGAIFLYYKDQCIGYGQIMLEDEKPIIVNFGLIEEYRGMGFSRILLNLLLKKVAMLNYRECFIKVSSSNDKALGLYKSSGFSIHEENSEYIYFT